MMPGLSLIDRLLHEVDGESAVLADAAALRFERYFDEVRALSRAVRMQLQAEITALRGEAATDVELRTALHARALDKVAVWEERAREAPPSFAAQAAERADAARADAEGIAQELAEYRATVAQLDALYVWIDQIERG
jgi:hypothetical protein